MMGGLALTSCALHPLASAVWNESHFDGPSFQFDRDAATSEQAIVVGLLGGLRAAVADVLWLKASQLAEAHDLAATNATLRLVSAVDSRSLYFWLNGARIIAYDLPEWKIAAAGGYGRVRTSAREAIAHDWARRALRRLDEAMRFHPASAALWIERANIELNRLGELAGAAESYRRAAEQPDAPWFAARLHAEMLRRLGKKADALGWLVRLHPQLPPTVESAGAGLVLARIRSLERELGVPAGQGYCQRGTRAMDPG